MITAPSLALIYVINQVVAEEEGATTRSMYTAHQGKEKKTAQEEEERERTTLSMSSSIRYIYSVRWKRGVIRLLRWKQARLQKPDQLQ